MHLPIKQKHEMYSARDQVNQVFLVYLQVFFFNPQ